MTDKTLTPAEALRALADGKTVVNNRGRYMKLNGGNLDGWTPAFKIGFSGKLDGWRIHHEPGSREWAQQMCDEGKVVVCWHSFGNGTITNDRAEVKLFATDWELYTEPKRAVGWYMAEHRSNADFIIWWDGDYWRHGKPPSIELNHPEFVTNIRAITIGEPEP